MSRVTKYKALYPWLGGLNTSVDPMILDSQNLTMADNIVFTTSGSRKKRGGQTHYNSTKIGGASAAQNVVYLADYWATVSSAKREYFIAVTDSGKAFRSPFNGTWTSFSTLTLSVSQGGVTSMVLQNNLVLGFKDSGVPKVWVGQNTASNLVAMTSATTSALPFTNAWITCPLLERGFYAGDPANPDRIYVSKVGTYNDFTSTASAGFATTLDVGIGDGDPDGVTAIFPGTGGDRILYAGKRNHLYRIDCSDIDQTKWKITLLTNEIGVISPNTVATIDMIDVIFASDRGVHTLNQILTTTGIIPSQYLSFPIQYDWDSALSTSDRKKFSAIWAPALNSYLISVKRSGQSTFETVYGFNVELKQWFRWTSVPCNFLLRRLNTSTGAEEIYTAASSGYVNKLQQTALNDFGAPIVAQIKSAFIAPDAIPFTENQFTNLACIYRSHENSTFRVYYSVDGLTTQNTTFAQKIAGGNILGTTILGSGFLLGQIQAIKPVWSHLAIDEGNTIQFTFQQDGLNQDFELFGIVLEYQVDEEAQNAFRSPLYG
jgi:hypothetical protein